MTSRIATLVLALATAPAVVAPLAAAERQRAPDAFACDRNALTSYTGAVIGYARSQGRTTLRIRTDWDTTERVVLRHRDTDDPSALFRIDGRAFAATDWPAIEASKGVLRTGLRATAWVCSDGRVRVDWNAPAE
jgi:hypothetical protein